MITDITVSCWDLIFIFTSPDLKGHASCILLRFNLHFYLTWPEGSCELLSSLCVRCLTSLIFPILISPLKLLVKFVPLQNIVISSWSNKQYGCHGQFLFVIVWNFFSSESPNVIFLVGTNDVCMVLYKNFSFCFDLAINMGNSFFWLTKTFKIFSSDSTRPDDVLVN